MYFLFLKQHGWSKRSALDRRRFIQSFLKRRRGKAFPLREGRTLFRTGAGAPMASPGGKLAKIFDF